MVMLHYITLSYTKVGISNFDKVAKCPGLCTVHMGPVRQANAFIFIAHTH